MVNIKDTNRTRDRYSIIYGDPTNSLVYSMVGTLLVLVILFIIEAYNYPFGIYFRYIAFLPTLLIAYHYGTRSGILVALVFSVIYIPELYQTIQNIWLFQSNNQVLTYILLLYTLTFIVAEIGTASRRRSALSSSVEEWRDLLAHTTDLEEVINFTLEQSRIVSGVEETQLFIQNPLDLQWELITSRGIRQIQLDGNYKNGWMSLSEWFLYRDEPFFLNHLDKKPTYIIPIEGVNVENALRLKSLLVQPFKHQDGIIFGILILINKTSDEFSQVDFQDIKGLVAGCERALEQAGLYAKANYSLARRVRQLSSIQRTARELNSALDPNEIAEETLKCALEISEAEAGSINIDMEGFPPIGKVLIGDKIVSKVNNTDIQDSPVLVHQENNSENRTFDLKPKVSSRLITPIQRGDLVFGYLLAESSSPKIFKDDSRHILSLLADHTSIALDNARLFQELLLEQQRVTTIINTMVDGIITTDIDGNIITNNQAVEQILGTLLPPKIGIPCCSVLSFHGENHSTGECKLLKAIRDKVAISELKFLITTDIGAKKTISLKMTPMPVSRGHPEGAVFLIRDISDQEEMEKLQKELIAAISHELRAPLANISTIAETLLSEVLGPTSNENTRYLNNLMSQTKRLADFSDRILDVYKMETGQIKMQLQPAPINLLIDQVVVNWRSIISHNVEVTLLPGRSPWVWVDEKCFESVLHNLIENAVKYSPSQTKVEVIIEPPSQGFITCGVRDQGPGIDIEFQEKVFRRFYRINGGDSQKVYGHGLGLYIAKTLVEAMGGKLWVTSEIGKGSYFMFTVMVMEEESERKDFNNR